MLTRTTTLRRARARRAKTATAIAIGTAVTLMVSSVPGSAQADAAALVPLGLPSPSTIGDYLPSAPLPASNSPVTFEKSPFDIPATVAWPTQQDTKTPLQTWLDDTNTRAFLVLQDGKIAYEWYDDSTSATTRLSSWSMAKSMVAVLLGQAVAEKKLSLDTRLVAVLPELAGKSASYDRITVGDLVDMTSGVDAPEGYTDVSSDLASLIHNLSGTSSLYATPDLSGYVKGHRTTHFEPGTQGEYVSTNTQILSMVLSKVYGKRYDQVFLERIWSKLPVPVSGTWNLDRPALLGGISKGFCCLNATARDFSILGQAVLHNDAVVSPEWRRRIFTPQPHVVLDDDHYSTGFWHPIAKDLKPQSDAAMIGVFGQFTYINRDTDTVIVKLGDDTIIPADMQQQFRIFRTIAQSSE
jgi:CubicO group peptidase (beta-lactamase class C family)